VRIAPPTFTVQRECCSEFEISILSAGGPWSNGPPKWRHPYFGFGGILWARRVGQAGLRYPDNNNRPSWFCLKQKLEVVQATLPELMRPSSRQHASGPLRQN
jgi:hypothetical protein